MVDDYACGGRAVCAYLDHFSQYQLADKRKIMKEENSRLRGVSVCVDCVHIPVVLYNGILIATRVHMCHGSTHKHSCVHTLRCTHTFTHILPHILNKYTCGKNRLVDVLLCSSPNKSKAHTCLVPKPLVCVYD